jgi:hypothetical protein
MHEFGANRKAWTARLLRSLPLVLLVFFAAPLLLVPITPANAGGGPMVPSGVLYYVPITLTNSQTSATVAGFQQMLVVNWNAYASHLNSGVQNVEFFDSSGTVLDAWCESSCSSSSASSVVWVNLGSDTIAANGGTLATYLGFLSTGTNNMGNSGSSVWGEAPQLSGSYGQYDDGANVFSFYDNFAGTTLSAKWVTAAATVTVNNGVRISGTSSTFDLTTASYTASSPFEMEAYGTLPVAGYSWAVGAGDRAGLNGIGASGFNGQSSPAKIQAGQSTPTAQTRAGNYGTTATTGIWTTEAVSTTTSNFYFDYGNKNTVSVDAPAYPVYFNLASFLANPSPAPSYSWARVRSYPPNGVMPSASFGPVSTASLTFASVGSNKVLFYIPVTLTNGQSSATPVDFQEMVTADPSAIGSSYFASNLQNVNWQDGGGNVLSSWLESGNTNTATSTVYWVNLDSRTIPAGGGTLTVYLCIYGTSVDALNTANTGEAPQLSASYGQYDDGANVFPAYYDNFAGTTIGSQYTQIVPATLSQNNGLTVTFGGNNYGGLVLTSGIASSPAVIFEADVTAANAVPNLKAEGIGLQTGTGTTSTSAGYWHGRAYSTGFYRGAFDDFQAAITPTHLLVVGVEGIAWLSTGHEVSYDSYSPTAHSDSIIGLTPTIYPSYGGVTISNGVEISYQWGRVRIYPPGGVMPSASFGPLTGITATAVACSPSTTVDVGSSTTCTATVTGESGPITGETITWSQTGGTGSVSFSPATTCSLAGSPESCSVSVTGATAGSATIQASYPGDAGNLASSNTTTITADPALAVGAPYGSPPTIDQGQASSLSANFSGGTTPYSCQWLAEAPGAGSFSDYGGPSSCTSPASASFPTTTSTTTGVWAFELQVTDGASNTVASSAGSMTVNAALSAVSVSPSGPSIDSGQSVTLTANPSGGTAPYSYQWYTSPGCSASPISGATGSTYGASSSATTTYYVEATDSSGAGAQSACSSGDTVTVNSALRAGAITPSSPLVSPGQSVSLTANPSGGTAPYYYQWYASAGCASPITGATSSTYDTGPLTSGATYYYQVTDSAYPPVVACSPGDTVNLLQPPKLPPVIPNQLTFNFNFPGAPTLIGHYVSLIGGVVLYNVPGYNATADVFPYAISFCYIPDYNLVRISGFFSVGPGANSTELLVSNWNSVVTNAQGWPAEPDCSSSLSPDAAYPTGFQPVLAAVTAEGIGTARHP